MKTLCMLLFTVSTLFTGIDQAQETETATATYLGTEAGVYHFQTEDEKLSFQVVDDKTAASVNLKNPETKGKTFTITYTVQEMEDEAGDIIDLMSIISITPAKD